MILNFPSHGSALFKSTAKLLIINELSKHFRLGNKRNSVMRCNYVCHNVLCRCALCLYHQVDTCQSTLLIPREVAAYKRKFQRNSNTRLNAMIENGLSRVLLFLGSKWCLSWDYCCSPSCSVWTIVQTTSSPASLSSTLMVSPGFTSASIIISARLSSRYFWIARLRGRAPYCWS